MTVNKDETTRVKAARHIQRIKDLMTYVKLTSDQYPDR
jgi:LysM repeat protein